MMQCNRCICIWGSSDDARCICIKGRLAAEAEAHARNLEQRDVALQGVAHDLGLGHLRRDGQLPADAVDKYAIILKFLLIYLSILHLYIYLLIYIFVSFFLSYLYFFATMALSQQIAPYVGTRRMQDSRCWYLETWACLPG